MMVNPDPNHAEGQGRHNPPHRAADRARMAAIARAMAIGAALAILVLFALGMPPANAATSATPTCPNGWAAITPPEWMLGALTAIVVGMAFIMWLGNRWREVGHVLGHSMANSNLSALASTRADTSCPGLQAANAAVATRPRVRAISNPRR